jgi:hypothetical protein
MGSCRWRSFSVEPTLLLLLFLQAKGLFQKLQVPAKVIELDVMKGGDDLQLGLQVRLLGQLLLQHCWCCCCY